MQTVKLGEVCTFVRGPFGGSLKKESFKPHGFAVFEQQHAIYNQFEEIRYFVDEKKYHEMERFRVFPGDIIMSCSGTMGKIAIVPDEVREGIINQALLKLTPSKRLSVDYLKYWMESNDFKQRIETNSHGAAIKNVASVKVLKEIPLPLPHIEEQRRIAAILDKADAIRRKRQQALTLADNFLRATFLDMFGDPTTNPKGWEKATIRELVSEVKYGTSAKADAVVGAFPILRMGNITYNGGWALEALKYVDLADNEIKKYTVKRGDLLFNRTNSKELVGKTAVFEEDETYAFAGYLVRARTNERADPYYISGYLNSKHGKTTLRAMCKSIVGMANINAQELQDISILIPPISLQMRYREIIDSVQQKRSKLISAHEIATNLFSSLSQRAFRGEL